MKTEKWKMRNVAGGGAPWTSVMADAVKVTKSNIEDVAKWTGGKVSRTGTKVFVPVNRIVGDPNKRIRVDAKTEKRATKAIHVEAEASVGQYVVKWRDLFFVVSEENLNQGWEQENA